MRYLAIVVCCALFAACGGSEGGGGSGDTPNSNPGSDSVPTGGGSQPALGPTDALTDAHIERFIPLVTEVAALGGPPPDMAGMKAWTSKRAAAIKKHGMSEMEYGILENRMQAAVTMLDFGVPIPAEMAADCEIAKKHLAALKAAMQIE